MRSPIVLALILATTSPFAVSTFGAEKPETPHIAFVREYIRELSAIETIREVALQDQGQRANDELFMSFVYSSTRMQFELRTQIDTLTGMRLNPPFEEVIPDLIALYSLKVGYFQRLSEIASAFIGDQKPGIDNSKLAADMPKVRAGLDDVDHTLAESTPLIFSTLIDPKPDSKNRASHLIITKAERAELLSDLTTRFGAKLDQKDQDLTISAASILKAGLLKDFRCSDEPWE